MRPHGPLGSRSASPLGCTNPFEGLGFRRLLEPNQRERGSICQPHTLYKIPLEFGCGANFQVRKELCEAARISGTGAVEISVRCPSADPAVFCIGGLCAGLAGGRMVAANWVTIALGS